MNIADARNDYRIILFLLRTLRSSVDEKGEEPQRSFTLLKIDAALTGLEHLGQIVRAAADAGLLETIYEQAPLLDLPPAPTKKAAYP